MATDDSIVCPFTGEKFTGENVATVSDVSNDTKEVRTPVLRRPVTLTRELFDDLPRYPARLKLGFRRWVADQIDRGELPSVLTSDHALDHVGHPEPTPEQKAYRLLGWMVAERRIGPRNPYRKFDFQDNRVVRTHQACLVTESEEREQLLDPLRRLQELGYVEYLGAGDNVVAEPRLTVRLTETGRENGGQPPLETVQQSPGAYTQQQPRFDDIINTLVDSSDADRSALLGRIIRGDIPASDTLVARIRDCIREDFAPKQEGRFGIAVRDPKRLASARSWMLSSLIWLDPLSVDSMTLILEHLDGRTEPDRLVRFWTLAGVVQRQLPYLGDALSRASADTEPDVSGLAAIAADPDSGEMLAGFRSSLESETFQTVWHVLRILRIVPVPALAPAVVAQLGRLAEGEPLTYDALFALAVREMAEAAQPIILKEIGLNGLVRMIIEEARSATPVSRSAFARVLLVFDQRQVREALQGAIKDAEDRRLVRRISEEIAAALKEGDAAEPAIAGVVSDAIDIDKDDIGIAHDVEILASAILARDVTPPLAIGLFGEWGSGKSFFMKSIKATALEITKRARTRNAGQFCSDVVQIEFNAWHYVDTSLWASLVDHILAELSKHLHPEPDPADQQAILAGELASAKAEMAAAERERQNANAHLANTAQTLLSKTLERERQEVKLTDFRAADLFSILKEDERLKLELDRALAAVGAPTALESIAELNRVVGESYSTAGRATTVLNSIFRGSSLAFMIGGIALVLVAPPLFAWGVEKLIGAHIASLSALTGQVAVIVGSIAAVLGQALRQAKAGLETLSIAKRKIDQKLSEKRAAPTVEECQLEKDLAKFKAEEQAAVEQYAVAAERARHLESKILEMVESRSVGSFIKARSGSEDYRRHLGLISTIRKDFDQLVERLQHPRSAHERKIDRIVLYIDDVDRCPPEMVVDILQAVHLLLAYELFVVVVSVDPRWLLRSLETSFSQLRACEPTIAETWAATPQDYLEKIFQIPYSVRPMGDRGYSRLIQRLFAPSIALSASTPRSALPGTIRQNSAREVDGGTVDSPVHIAGSPGVDTKANTRSLGSTVETGTGVVADDGAGSGTLPGEDSNSAARAVVDATSQGDPGAGPGTEGLPGTVLPLTLGELAESLSISEAETAFAQTLGGLLRTPRSAKRFANVYRLFKAALPRSDVPQFDGTPGVPGDFQLPMLLLALLVGDPKSAATLFPQFLVRATKGEREWWRLGADEQADALDSSATAPAILQNLDDLLQAAFFPRAPELVVEWLPLVARYSFTTARMYLDKR